MSTSVEHASLPPDLPLTKGSFYSKGGSVNNVKTGTHCSYEYFAFDYDTQSGDMPHTETIVAIKTTSPRSPATDLSRASGLRLERVGEWIFAFEAQRIISHNKIDTMVDDVIKLLEYAKGLPQST
jgi:hypothetical protein